MPFRLCLQHALLQATQCFADRRFELYDLSRDVGEEHDLAREQPEEVRRLARVLGLWMRDARAQMSIDTTTGGPVEWPDEVTLSSDP